MNSPDAAERGQLIQRLFDEAFEYSPDERSAFLERACPHDADLRREVASLLEALDAHEEEVRLALERLVPVHLALPVRPSDEGRLAGRTIAPYQILKQIGRGGMGEVYLALREEPFRQYVALKLIRQGVDAPEVLRRFHLERQILASLSHPGIARLLDGGTTEDGLAYLVMEYVEGKPLTRFCDEQRLSLHERLHLFQEVCQAVHYAHQNLIVHRDLKPSNILVTEARQVKLLDFGVAKLLNPALSSVEVPVTRTVYRMLTPEYAAPEQVRGEAITTATDVYALGVLLYELLTGHRPYRFETGSAGEIERVICEQEVERPSLKVGRSNGAAGSSSDGRLPTPTGLAGARDVSVERLRRQLRGDLDNIVLKALRKEPHLRYGSAEQLAAEVGRYLAGLPVEARPSTVRYRVRKFVHRHRVAAAAATIAVLALVGALSVTVWQMQLARAERDRTEAALARSETVTAFLAGLFEASDPQEARGDTLTSYELLERGVARIDALEEEPLVQARMLDVVGRVYRSLAAYEQAGTLLERSLALRQVALGTAHADVAESLQSLAVLRLSQGRYDVAEALFRRALDVRRTVLGSEHPSVAESLAGLASVLQDNGRYDEAEVLHREALALRRRLLGETHADVGHSLNALGLVLYYRSKYDEAEVLLREALTLRRRLFAGEHTDHPDLAISLNNLALVLQQKNDYAEAEVLLREALAMWQRLLGEEHPDVTTCMSNLALLLYNRGDYAEAEALARKVLALDRKQLGAEHPYVAQSLNRVALVLQHREDYLEAEQLFRQALDMQRRLLDADHVDIAITLNHLASLNQARGRYATSESLYVEALSIFRKQFDEGHSRIQQIQQALATLQEAREPSE